MFDVSLDSESDLNDLQPSDFMLFRLVFQGTALGTSAISLNSRADAAGDDLAALKGGSVTVEVVPIPAAALLFGSALGVMGELRRKVSA